MPGQGLRALTHRLVRRSDATAHDGSVRSIHLVDLSKLSADGIYLALGILTLGALLVTSWRRVPGRGHPFSAVEIAAACAAMALLGPLSRKAHFVLLWPAAVVAFADASCHLRGVGFGFEADEPLLSEERERAWQTLSSVHPVFQRIDRDEAEWLAGRVGRDGRLHPNERALLAFVEENTHGIDPALKALLAQAAA